MTKQAKGATPKPAKKRATRSKAKTAKLTAKPDLTASATPAAVQSKQAHNDQYSVAQIIAALEASAGIVSAAARTLRCARRTIYRYIERYPEISDAVSDIEEDVLDAAESVIVTAMGNQKNPMAQIKAAEFYLRTKGKKRGYTTSTEVTGKGGAAIETKSQVTYDLSNLSPEDIAHLEKAATASVKAAAATHR